MPLHKEDRSQPTYLSAPSLFVWSRSLSVLRDRLNTAEEKKAMRYVPTTSLDADAFLKHVQLLRKSKLTLRLEWQTLQRLPFKPHSVAMLTENTSKNLFGKVVPFDDHRVVLKKLPQIEEAEFSDYVNASFIDSFHEPEMYICTQGPDKKTTKDFWQMVWQENVGCIVMVTRVFDFTKVVCTEYWKPPEYDESNSYGGFEVEILAKETLANFIIRTIKLSYKGAPDQPRTIKHFQYLEWPMHRIPVGSQLLEFRRRVRNYHNQILQTELNGPILVHCCDGAGRSGVFCAIDCNLELMEKEGQVDVLGSVKMMRAQRPFMVETLEQYAFIYSVLEEALVTGPVCFPVIELPQHMKWLSLKQPGEKKAPYQQEFDLLMKMSPLISTGDCAGGHRTENRNKNRDVVLVPPDFARPYLASFQGNDMTDYINAVYVDGYQRKNEFIVTEWPLRHTLCDFWSLVYDHDCTTVVILANPPATKKFPSFFPTRGKKSYGIFSLETMQSHEYNNFSSWVYKIRKKTLSLSEVLMGAVNEVKTTHLFLLGCWPVKHKVPTSTTAVIELMNMVDRWRQRTVTTGPQKPILIVSLDGVTRAGVYCAAQMACEQVTMHQEVDVFHAVKAVKANRPQLVENAVEYKYCYDLVRHYVYMVAFNPVTSTALLNATAATAAAATTYQAPNGNAGGGGIGGVANHAASHAVVVNAGRIGSTSGNVISTGSGSNSGGTVTGVRRSNQIVYPHVVGSDL